MCGIAGFTRFIHATGDMGTLKKMGDAIYHRGPDAHGEYLDDKVGLCHRRLSILDLSEAGNQPMVSEDGDYVIVFNGEIYNFIELRDELRAKGHHFNTGTDTEVLLKLYQEDGDGLLDKINGMFAFAIWDKQKETLFLARDRLGKKPLYYYAQNGYFVFGSELKCLLELPEIPRKIRPDAVYDYFTYQYVPDPKSIFEDIYKLEPGHCLTISTSTSTSESSLVKKQYWDVSFASQTTESPDQVSKTLLDKITLSTEQRMISDVPLGAFLSGGVDSSGVVALMSKISPTPVTTCTIGFDSEKYDEVDYAKEVSDQFNTEHHEFTVRKTVEDNLENIAGFFDEPFSDPSLVPTFFVSELARQQVTVALAGDGGDESFAGYSKYASDALENQLRNMVPKTLRTTLIKSLAKKLEGSQSTILRKAQTLLKSLSVSPEYGFFLTNSFFKEDLWQRLATDEFKKSLGDYHPSSVTTDHYHRADGDDHLSKILYTDFKTYLPGDILVKVDRMSMANSLEVRAPLLDYKVVEYAGRIASNLKLAGKDKKHILKKAFSSFLSDKILYRKKMGFSVPLAEWLRNEIREQTEVLLFKSERGLPDYFDMKAVKTIWQQHQNHQHDHSSELWSMLMFQLWFNRYAAH